MMYLRSKFVEAPTKFGLSSATMAMISIGVATGFGAVTGAIIDVLRADAVSAHSADKAFGVLFSSSNVMEEISSRDIDQLVSTISAPEINNSIDQEVLESKLCPSGSTKVSTLDLFVFAKEGMEICASKLLGRRPIVNVGAGPNDQK